MGTQSVWLLRGFKSLLLPVRSLWPGKTLFFLLYRKFKAALQTHVKAHVFEGSTSCMRLTYITSVPSQDGLDGLDFLISSAPQCLQAS